MLCRNCRFGRRRTRPAGGDGLMRAVQSGLSQQFVELSTLRTRNYLIEGDQIRVDGALGGVSCVSGNHPDGHVCSRDGKRWIVAADPG
jgi:hypothetical protein